MSVTVAVMELAANRSIVFQWAANPVNDMYADAVLTVVLKAETDTMPHKGMPLNILEFRRRSWKVQKY